MNNIDLDTLAAVTGGTSQTTQLLQSQLMQLTTSLQNTQPAQSQQQQLMMGLALGTMLRR